VVDLEKPPTLFQADEKNVDADADIVLLLSVLSTSTLGLTSTAVISVAFSESTTIELDSTLGEVLALFAERDRNVSKISDKADRPWKYHIICQNKNV
jgi:hypothetical protein